MSTTAAVLVRTPWRCLVVISRNIYTVKLVPTWTHQSPAILIKSLNVVMDIIVIQTLLLRSKPQT